MRSEVGTPRSREGRGYCHQGCLPSSQLPVRVLAPSLPCVPLPPCGHSGPWSLGLRCLWGQPRAGSHSSRCPGPDRRQGSATGVSRWLGRLLCGHKHDLSPGQDSRPPPPGPDHLSGDPRRWRTSRPPSARPGQSSLSQLSGPDNLWPLAQTRLAPCRAGPRAARVRRARRGTHPHAAR